MRVIAILPLGDPVNFYFLIDTNIVFISQVAYHYTYDYPAVKILINSYKSIQYKLAFNLLYVILNERSYELINIQDN